VTIIVQVLVLNDASTLSVNLKEMLEQGINQMETSNKTSDDNIRSRAQDAAEQEAIFSSKFKIEVIIIISARIKFR